MTKITLNWHKYWDKNYSTKLIKPLMSEFCNTMKIPKHITKSKLMMMRMKVKDSLYNAKTSDINGVQKISSIYYKYQLIAV